MARKDEYKATEYDRTEIREFIDNTFKDADITIPDLSESVLDDLVKL